MSGDDLKRVRQTLCEIRDYCERIALHLHRINGKDGFLHDLMDSLWFRGGGSLPHTLNQP